jgi:hypothetical protein
MLLKTGWLVVLARRSRSGFVESLPYVEHGWALPGQARQGREDIDEMDAAD